MIQNNINTEICIETNESLDNMNTFQTLRGYIYLNSKVIQIC